MLRALPQVRAALRGCVLIHSLSEPYAPLPRSSPDAARRIVTGHGSYVLAGDQRRFPVGALYRWAKPLAYGLRQPLHRTRRSKAPCRGCDRRSSTTASISSVSPEINTAAAAASCSSARSRRARV